MAQSTSPARCTAQSDRSSLGCSRSAGHTGSHWLTGNPEAAFASLVGQGFFARPLTAMERSARGLCAHAGSDACDVAGECVGE